MTLLPKVKLKVLPTFPATIHDGTGIDVTRENGTVKFDLAFDDFAPPVEGLADPARENALLWNDETGAYKLVPISLLGGGDGEPGPGTGGIPDAPADGLIYGRRSAGWDQVDFILPDFMGTGSDDTAALLEQVALAPGNRVKGIPGRTYTVVGEMALPSNMSFDLNGATLRIDYAEAGFALKSAGVNLGAINTVTSFSANHRILNLSGAPSGVTANDIIAFIWVDTTQPVGDNVGRYPVTYRTVTGTGATSINLNAPIPYDFPADTTLTVRKITFSGNFELKNGTVDLAGVLHGESTGPFYTIGYKLVNFENLEVINQVTLPGSAENYLFYTDYCLNTYFRKINIRNSARRGGILTSSHAQKCVVEDMWADGDGFGLAPVNCDDFDISNVNLTGRWNTQSPSYSTRGIRAIGCLSGRIRGATIIGYDSAIKTEDCSATQVSDFRAARCNVGFNISNQRPRVGYGQHSLTGFHFSDTVNSTGAIYFGDELCNDIHISNGLIERCLGHGISFAGRNNVISNIVVRDWGSGSNPVTASVINSVEPSGYVGNISAELTGSPGTRLGFSYPMTAIDLTIGPHQVTGITGKTFELCPGNDEGMRLITSGTSAAFLGGDRTLAVKRSGTGAILLTLPGTPRNGQICRAVDSKGDAATSNVNVGGVHQVDGAAYYSINTNFGWVEVQFCEADNQWHVIGK